MKREQQNGGALAGDVFAGDLVKELIVVREADAAKDSVLQLLGRITSQHEVPDICRAAVEGVRELMGFERAGLFLWDDTLKTFRGTFGTDMNLKTTDERHYVIEILPGSPEERIVAGSVIERGCKLGSPDARPGEEAVTADLLALRLEGRLYGLLSVDNRLSRRPISDRELEHLMLVSQVLGNALEISQARVALSQSEERFRQVAENSGEWIWELDRDGKYKYCSPVVWQILGYKPEQVTGKPMVDWVYEEDRPRMMAELRRAFVEKAALTRVINHQVHKDGFQVALETTGIPILDLAGNVAGYRGAHRDVTREKDLEMQLRHSQKIEAIGRLAGGIAHDFNNLLTAILGCGSLLLEELHEDDPVRADIEKIKAAGERAAVLTKQLLAFSRRQVLKVDRQSVNNIVRDMEKLLRRTLGEDIELITRMDLALPQIDTDADQLQQVILHLAINAREAMVDPQVGLQLPELREEMEKWREKVLARSKHLCIETSSALLDPAFCTKHVGIKPGPHVVISIRDTGIGMPKEVREHLFEPYFTTKEVGRGSGLGLSTVYGIVKQMGGYIAVESELGEGSTFKIYLPLSADPSPRRTEVVEERRNVRGKETILVVEDEEVVRSLIVRMLQTLGYQTMQAPHGGEALEICRTFKEPIHLILTDMIMPHMSGKQFVEELQKFRSDSKVLFVSGYSGDDTVDGKVIGVDTPLIQKPFTRETLGRKIRELLDAK
jgi:two-component system, cell cycle sensor histidine kinase and response regulator CckA